MAKKEEKAAKPKRTRKIWWRVVLGCVAMGVVLAGMIGYAVWWNTEGSKTELEKRGLPDRGLPVMEITLADGLELAEIDGGDKDVKYEGNEVDLYEGRSVFEFDDVEVKGRGNFSWVQPKKSYQIKFKNNVNLLGLNKSKKWILLGNYLDPTFMRDDIVFMLAEMLEIKYNHRGKFVELYIDGEYRGIYYITQRIEVASGSVDLRWSDGILFEMDNLHREPTDECHKTYLEECLVLKDAVANDDIYNEKIGEEFLQDFNRAEKAAESGDYKVVSELLDTESFAKYFLVNEFAVNPDGYSTSFYLYRDSEGKIAAGPVWDFDLAFANRVWGDSKNKNFYSPRESMARREEVLGNDGSGGDPNTSKLIYYLIEISEFREEILKVFQERMMGRKQELIQKIIMKEKEIYWAAEADERTWMRGNFEKELTEMMEWIWVRYEYFEEIYGNTEYGYQEMV